MHLRWLSRTTFSCQKMEKDNRNIPFHLVLKCVRNESNGMNPRKKTRPLTYGSVHRVVWDWPQWGILVLRGKLRVYSRSAEAALNLDHFNLQGRTWMISLDLAQVWVVELIESFSHPAFAWVSFSCNSIEGTHSGKTRKLYPVFSSTHFYVLLH